MLFEPSDEKSKEYNPTKIETIPIIIKRGGG
jgi:hypothetical protein